MPFSYMPLPSWGSGMAGPVIHGSGTAGGWSSLPCHAMGGRGGSEFALDDVGDLGEGEAAVVEGGQLRAEVGAVTYLPVVEHIRVGQVQVGPGTHGVGQDRGREQTEGAGGPVADPVPDGDAGFDGELAQHAEAAVADL